MASTLVFVRYAPGLIGETARQAHVLELDDPHNPPSLKTALCGIPLVWANLETLPMFDGMPCEVCALWLAHRPGVAP